VTSHAILMSPLFYTQSIYGSLSVDLRDLVKALLQFETLTARQWLADAARSGFIWSDVPSPDGLDEMESAVAAGVAELLAARAGQPPPPWAAAIPPAPKTLFLVRSAATMPRLRAACEQDGPEPLRRRGLLARLDDGPRGHRLRPPPPGRSGGGPLPSRPRTAAVAAISHAPRREAAGRRSRDCRHSRPVATPAWIEEFRKAHKLVLIYFSLQPVDRTAGRGTCGSSCRTANG
jgi:hypothetical protein